MRAFVFTKQTAYRNAGGRFKKLRRDRLVEYVTLR